MRGVVDIAEVEDMLPEECINDICQQGQGDEAVEKWQRRLIDLELTKEECIKLLCPCGAWDPADLREEPLYSLEQKVIWIAAWNVHDREC